MVKWVKIAAMMATATLAVGVAQAEDSGNTNASNAKISDIAQPPAVQTQKDIDSEITNARMRASLGSKSQWSVRTALGYNGGSVESPLASIRPNYQAGNTQPIPASLGGTVGIKYSINKNDSLALNTGLSVNDPLHGDTARSTYINARNKAVENRYELSNPSLTFDHAYKTGGLQMISEAVAQGFTQTFYSKGFNYAGELDLTQTVLADLGSSKWSAGLQAGVSLYATNGAISPEFAANGIVQDDYTLALYPFAEYSISDRYSFRTVFGYFVEDHVKGDQSGALQAETPYQSMGIGISLTRNVYLYPNVQFTPFDIRADRTNVALSANMSVF